MLRDKQLATLHRRFEEDQPLRNPASTMQEQQGGATRGPV